jgi:hypothetical protein
MPLVVTDVGAVQEKPLSWLVLHARLRELYLDSIYSLLAAVLLDSFSYFAYRMGGAQP